MSLTLAFQKNKLLYVCMFFCQRVQQKILSSSVHSWDIFLAAILWAISFLTKFCLEITKVTRSLMHDRFASFPSYLAKLIKIYSFEKFIWTVCKFKLVFRYFIMAKFCYWENNIFWFLHKSFKAMSLFFIKITVSR